MRKSVREVSVPELVELAERYGVEVDDEVAETVRDGVNERIRELDELYEIPVAGQSGLGERSWAEPTDDPYNSLSTVCRVEPAADHDGSMAGVTVGLKDVIAVAGVPMQCASALMQGYVPSSDATVVTRLREAGAEVTAKTNLDEFAAGGRAMSFAGRILNPHDTDRVTGGSSGGSAAAVAAGQVDVALGTDTGGSVRLPAAFCGVVGMKPTYGLVPLSGVVENTYSLDHVGPMGQTVADVAGLLVAIAGKDPTDTASMAAAGRDAYRVGGYREAVADPPDPSALRVGVLRDGMDGVTDGVRERTEATLDALADDGATVEPVSVGGFDLAPMVKNAITFHELAAYWRDGGAPYRRGGEASVDAADLASFAHRARSGTGELDPFYLGRILAGARLMEAHGGRYYARAKLAKRAMRERFEDAVDGFDALAWPTARDVAPLVDDADLPDTEFGRNTRVVNLTGLPAVSVPNGTVDGLPVGLQLLGPAFGDATLLGAAATVEATVGAA